MVTKLLDELISDSSESAFERATLPVGIEERIRTVDWSRRDVLIGLVPDKEHLDLFLKNRMYWTRRFDKDHLPIRYVALYEKGAGIRYFGEMVSWHEENRKDLPGESKYENEKYHVFDVLKWIELEDTIKVEESGPNPVAYTNYFLLSTSKSYSELRLRSEADYRLFMELKRRTDTKILDEDEDARAFETGDVRVLMKNGEIFVVRDGEILDEIEVQAFERMPNAMVRRMREYMGELE